MEITHCASTKYVCLSQIVIRKNMPIQYSFGTVSIAIDNGG
jgi:hypothetical protein